MKDRAWVISNGNINDYRFYKNIISTKDLIICADGGAIHALNMEIIPDVIIGDMDSISTNKDYYQRIRKEVDRNKVEVVKYPTSKDKTDTQLSVEYAIRKGCKKIILTASLGSRFDHSFANISMLKLIMNNNIKGMVLNEYNEIYLVNKHIKLKGEIGQILSIIPISEKVSGISTKGLKYELNNGMISLGNSCGVSNVFINTLVEVSIKNGLALIIKTYDEL